MKKLISILLAILMTFSLITVAFAEDSTVPEDETTTLAPEDNEGSEEVEGDAETEEPLLGEYDWLLDLPFWTVGPALKFAKIALKLVNVYLKVAKIFGLVDKDMGDHIMEVLIDMVVNAQNAENNEAPEETTTAPEETTAPATA